MSNPFDLICDRLSSIEEILQTLQSGDIKEVDVPIIVPVQGEKPLNIQELSAHYNWSKSTVHRLKDNGTIPYHRIGRKVWFLISEIDAVARIPNISSKKKGKV